VKGKKEKIKRKRKKERKGVMDEEKKEKGNAKKRCN